MAKISTYPQPTPPQLSDYVIGTDISDLLMTKNFLLSDIISLATTTGQFVTIVGAQTITGSKTFDYGTSTGVAAPVIINLPNQTQPAFSPDALLIQINGQTPSTIPGMIGGVVVEAQFLDNICFFGNLYGNSGASKGIVINSVDSHNGYLLEFKKTISSPFSESPIFTIETGGNTRIYSTSGTALIVSANGLLGTDNGIQTGSYRGNAISAGTYDGIGINASCGGSLGVAVKAVATPGVPGTGLALLTIGNIKTQSLPTFPNNSTAVLAGLPIDCIYKTATGELRIVV